MNTSTNILRTFLAFQVSQGFLIKCYNMVETLVSTVTSESDLNSGPEKGTVLKTSQLSSIYLVEPRRVSTAVLKFSGTLGVRNGIDKRTATISAFSHFVVGSTACNYMFADIQGKAAAYLIALCIVITFQTFRFNRS